jgi:hypothetical protein
MLLFIPVKPPVPCPYSDILSHLLCRFRRYRRIFADTISAKLKAYRGPYREKKSVADICHSDIGNIGEPAKSGTADQFFFLTYP